MHTRLAKTLLATAAVTALAVPAGAQARHGADDPAGHVRHSSHQSSAVQSKHRSRSRHHARRLDDNSAQRRGRGTDDGPNHS